MSLSPKQAVLWTMLLPLVLGGCGIFGSKEEPIEPPAELTDIEPVLTVRKAWDTRVGSGSELLNLALRPAVEGGRVYAAGRNGRVHALDLETGRSQWTVRTELALSAGPTVGHGLVLVGGTGGMLVALAMDDGAERWRSQLAGEVLAPPAVSPTVVVVRTVDGRLHGLSAADGRELWMVEQQPPRLTLRGTSAPTIAGNVVVTGFDTGRIGAYLLQDGEAQWENVIAVGRGRTEIERLADVDATPQVIGQDLYAVSYGGRLANLAIESGQILWTAEMSSYNGLSLDWTSVYVAAADGEVVALNRSSGAELWRQGALRMRRLTAPTPVGQSVVVGDFEGWLHWLDAFTGAIQARYRAGKAAIVTAPVSGGELLIVQDEDDRVYALRAGPRG
ncbi:MAG TPA: outer membrane protein assembly factor BamB [Gammaproteobacteria bacterium]|nr:outer membrane protein assembly factor BamB [Gammaproteobacteria bacterium]HRP87900.1 outer membrane protein assembly factor BamB [Gammaproteobacteria bacterium]